MYHSWMVGAKKRRQNISLVLVPRHDLAQDASLSTFLARFHVTITGKITYILAMKESEWRETVDAISKSTHSNPIYEFAFIFDLISR